MKKGYYFYTLLTKEEQQELKKELGLRLKFYLKSKHLNFDGFISCLFMWVNTEKGHNYWLEISRSERTHKKASKKRHEFKVMTKKDVNNNRSKAYDHLNF